MDPVDQFTLKYRNMIPCDITGSMVVTSHLQSTVLEQQQELLVDYMDIRPEQLHHLPEKATL